MGHGKHSGHGKKAREYEVTAEDAEFRRGRAKDSMEWDLWAMNPTQRYFRKNYLSAQLRVLRGNTPPHFLAVSSVSQSPSFLNDRRCG